MDPSPKRGRTHDLVNDDAKGSSLSESDLEEEFLGEVPRRWHRISWLAPSDDAVLSLLGEYSDPAGRRMLDMIRGRRVFKRFEVISEAGGDRDRFEEIYSLVRAYLSTDDQRSIEDLRQREEQKVKARLASSGVDTSRIEPVLLLDVPVKSPDKAFRQEALWYLEEGAGLSSEAAFSVLKPVRSDIEVELSQFDKRAGKIRWLIHPDAHSALVAAGVQAESTGQSNDRW